MKPSESATPYYGGSEHNWTPFVQHPMGERRSFADVARKYTTTTIHGLRHGRHGGRRGVAVADGVFVRVYEVDEVYKG